MTPLDLQIYSRTGGDGFSEECSVKRAVWLTPAMTSHRIDTRQHTKPVAALRIDFGDTPDQFLLHELVLRGSSEEEVLRWSGDLSLFVTAADLRASLTPLGVLVECLEGDPHVIVDVTDLEVGTSASIEISASSVELGGSEPAVRRVLDQLLSSYEDHQRALLASRNAERELQDSLQRHIEALAQAPSADSYAALNTAAIAQLEDTILSEREAVLTRVDSILDKVRDSVAALTESGAEREIGKLVTTSQETLRFLQDERTRRDRQFEVRHRQNEDRDSLARRFLEAALARSQAVLGDQLSELRREVEGIEGKVADRLGVDLRVILDAHSHPARAGLDARMGSPQKAGDDLHRLLVELGCERHPGEALGQVMRLKRELSEAIASIHAMTASSSWRLTSPLRGLKRLFMPHQPPSPPRVCV